MGELTLIQFTNREMGGLRLSDAGAGWLREKCPALCVVADISRRQVQSGMQPVIELGEGDSKEVLWAGSWEHLAASVEIDPAKLARTPRAVVDLLNEQRRELLRMTAEGLEASFAEHRPGANPADCCLVVHRGRWLHIKSAYLVGPTAKIGLFMDSTFAFAPYFPPIDPEPDVIVDRS